MNYVKSCLNYTGGKYRILNQILPFFPNNITNFIDLFCGGANIALNIEAENIYCYDNNKHLISLFNFIKQTDLNEFKSSINDIIKQYNLSDSDKFGYEYYGCDSSNGLSQYNKQHYLKLRDDFNNNLFSENINKNIYFYTLIMYGFNNQIRFNKKEKYNIPVGKRDFNSRVQNNLEYFSKTIKDKDIKFDCKDFRDVTLENKTNGLFLYADPPYLITNASYNEQNGWTEKDEIDLLNFLDYCDSENISFALSNVIKNKGKTNNILLKWSEKYNINYINFNYNNANYQIKDRSNETMEVLITNY